MPRPFLIDSLLYFAPERQEFDAGGVLYQHPLQGRVKFDQLPLRFSAIRAAADMKPHPFAVSRGQLAVKPTTDQRSNRLTLIHKKALNLSCNFFRA
jgi:hypothetical protein